MAYSKLPKAIQDYGLGYQTINQAIDNIEAIRDVYGVEHNITDALTFAGAASSIPEWGQHNHSAIAKSVAIVNVYSYSVVSGVTQYAFNVSLSGRVIRNVTRFQAGIYVVLTDQLTNASANATPVATTSAVRMCKVHPLPVTTGQFGWIVALKEQASAGAAFSVSDFSFHFRVWGQ